MSDTQITRIPIFPFGMVNAYLIRGEAGCILVDTGIPGSEKKVDRVLKQHGVKFRDIKLIVVTHAHTDHAGAAARLRSLSGAPILAHYADVDFFTRKREMTLCPTGPFGRFFIKTPLPHQPYEAFEPDIMMRDGETTGLLDFGIDGTVRHVGGHTPGSIAIELASQEALIGDLVSSGIPTRRHRSEASRDPAPVRGRPAPCRRRAATPRPPGGEPLLHGAWRSLDGAGGAPPFSEAWPRSHRPCAPQAVHIRPTPEDLRRGLYTRCQDYRGRLPINYVARGTVRECRVSSIGNINGNAKTALPTNSLFEALPSSPMEMQKRNSFDDRF